MNSDTILIHFNPKSSLVLDSGVSSYGICVVLSHVMQDNDEKATGFESRIVTNVE